MATVQDVIDRAEALLSRQFKSVSPAAFRDTVALLWVQDCYRLIADRVRVPRTSAAQNSVAGQHDYSLPADCWDGIDGLIALIYDTKPLHRVYLQDMIDRYGEDWTVPPDQDGPTWYLDYNDSAKYRILPAPTAVKAITQVYVQQVAKPAAFSTAIPAIYEPYVTFMPLYLIGRAMELDEKGRGGAMLAEFEGRLLKKWRVKERRGRRTAAEGYTLGLNEYRRTYARHR